jgi:hypothetical protein
MKMKPLPLALAISSVLGLSMATYADDSDGGKDHGPDSNVEINKEINVYEDHYFTSDIQAMGLILIDSKSTAVSEVNQKSADNEVYNGSETTNTAGAGDDVLNGATGNIGLNVAAGDNNVQQNSTAIAASQSQGTEINFDFDFNSSESVSNSNVDDQSYSEAAAAEHSASASRSSSHTKSGSVDYTKTTDTTTNWEAEYGGYEEHLDINGSGELAVSAGEQSSQSDDGAGNTSSSSAAQLEIAGDINLDANASGSHKQVNASGTKTSNGQLNKNATWSKTHEANEEYSESSSYNQEASASSHHDDSYDRSYSMNANIDATLVFGGAADAETFSNQVAAYNSTHSYGTTNDASLGGNAGLDAAGNIGINIAAGDSNVQANQLALASASGALATATASSNQVAYGNYTSNEAVRDTIVNTVDVVLSGDATGTYNGTSDQVGDVYLDTWTDEVHPGGDNTGHIDVDNQAQGAQDPNGDGGAFLFSEAGIIDLDNISLGGKITYTQTIYKAHSNNASVGSNVLAGASGNIGLNVAAGTNNVQGNALAIANVSVPVAPPGGGGGEQ